MWINNDTYYVYIHTNKVNNKVYIGKTSRTPEERWKKNGYGYLQKKNGVYIQPLFARAILKYGWDNFEHIIWAEGLSAEKANEIEMLLIALYNSNDPEYGYNLRSGGNNGKHSEETRKKMSESRMGDKNPMYGKRGKNNPLYGTHVSEESKRKNSEKHKGLHSHEKHPMARPVQCIETGEVLWGSKAFEMKYGYSAGHICNCCNGKRNTSNGYHWKYYIEENDLVKIS